MHPKVHVITSKEKKKTMGCVNKKRSIVQVSLYWDYYYLKAHIKAPVKGYQLLILMDYTNNLI
jgi:hypothetical protein